MNASKKPVAQENIFFLVLNVLDVQVDLPVELVPGHWLRRADTSEMDRIRHFFEVGSKLDDYKTLFEKKSDTPLPEAQWRYYVVEQRDNSSFHPVINGHHAIEEASRLTNGEINCSVHFYPSG
jgi:hypothetical protein